jgi:hypothetical protein
MLPAMLPVASTTARHCSPISCYQRCGTARSCIMGRPCPMPCPRGNSPPASPCCSASHPVVTQSSASRARSSLTAVPFSSPCRFLCALHHEYKAYEAPVACISFRLSAAARSKLCLSAPLALLWLCSGSALALLWCECCAPPTTQLQLLQWPKSSAPYRYRCQHQHPRVVADTAGWPVTTSPCNLTPSCSPRVSRTSIACRRRAIRITRSPRASNSGRV